MKRSFVLFPALAFAVLFICAAPMFAAETSDDSELEGLLTRIGIIAHTLTEKGYAIVHIEVDKLEKNQTYTASRQLYDVNDYVIMGIGGVGVKDMDMKLYDENDNLIDKDESEDNVPLLQVTPKADGKYYIKTTVASLESDVDQEGEYFFCWIIGFKRTE
jgi:hypothetical protein